MNTFLNLENARTHDQKELMEKIIADGVCPFCKENFARYHPKPVLKETEHWFFSENMSPYEGTKHHYIFVYKPAHISTPAEMSQAAWSDLLEIIRWALKQYSIDGGTVAMRFGTAKKFANSVMHLHGHLIEPDVDNPSHPGVTFRVSKATE